MICHVQALFARNLHLFASDTNCLLTQTRVRLISYDISNAQHRPDSALLKTIGKESIRCSTPLTGLRGLAAEVIRSGDLISYTGEEGMRRLGEGKMLMSDAYPGQDRTKLCLSQKVGGHLILRQLQTSSCPMQPSCLHALYTLELWRGFMANLALYAGGYRTYIEGGGKVCWSSSYLWIDVPATWLYYKPWLCMTHVGV